MRRLLGVLVVFALVPSVAVAATASTPWKSHTVTSAGFKVAAPASWIDVTRLSPQVLAKASEKIPSLKQYVELAQQSKAIKLILLDAGTTTVVNHYATNMNVVEVPSIGDLQLLHDATIAQLKSTGLVVGNIAAGYVTLPAGKAVKLQYRAKYSATTPVVSLLQFLFLHNGVSAVITYTTLPKLKGTYGAAFARSARSFTFL